MEVSSKDDFATHVVVGRNEPIGFGISDRPEFFLVLSRSLYGEPLLAVVREIMCNAWDAHIEAGRTDVPVEVSFGEGHMVIRDRGPGIPREMIGSIYGVYGSSDKTPDKRVTGGFGLGSKAPFAYVDHFEVTSWNQGTRTVYAMSRSSPDLEGRPGIVPLVSVPCQESESGLAVKVRIASVADEARLKELARRVAANGGIRAVVDGVPTDAVALSERPGDFVVTSRQLVTNHGGRCGVFVRYGSVVYPVPDHEAYQGPLEEAGKFLNVFHMRGGSRHHLLLQAAPGSLSLTPSRESLSMQDRTVETLTAMLRAFRDEVVSRVRDEARSIIAEATAAAVARRDHARMLHALDEPAWPAGTNTHRLWPIDRDMSGMRLLAGHYMGILYFQEFAQEDREGRLRALSRSDWPDRGLARGFLDEARGKKAFLGWFGRTVLRKLYRDVAATPGMSTRRFFVYHTGISTSLIAPQKFPGTKVEQWMPLLRKIAVLAYSQADFANHALKFPELSRLGPLDRGCFLYTVQRGKNHADLARWVLRKNGFTLLDLTVAQPFHDPHRRVSEAADRGPRPKGWPALYGLLDSTRSNGISLDRASEDDVPRLLEPGFSARFEATRYEDNRVIVRFDMRRTREIVRHLGDVGALCVSTTQEAAMLKRGIPSCDRYVVEHALREMRENPRIRGHVPFAVARHIKRLESQGKARADSREMALAKVLAKHPVTRAMCGLEDERTEKDRFWSRMWAFVREMHAPWVILGDERKTCRVAELKDELDAVPLDPAAKRFFEVVQDNKLLGLFNVAELEKLLNQANTTDRVVDILGEAFKD